jgi:FkbM family methyltransferase
MSITKGHLRAPLAYFKRRRGTISKFLEIAKAIGWAAAWKFFKASDRSRRGIHRLRPRGAQHPVLMRLGSSDFEVFKQVFVRGDYRCVSDLEAPSLIVDLGANVGYSATFFLSAYPRARIIALEPDDQNYAVLADNIRPYRKRAIAVEAGVWSHLTKLSMRTDAYRDGCEWGRQVQENPAGSIDGLDIEAILSRYAKPHDRISLLKIDIEGAEVVLFSGGRPQWLDRVDVMAIELHDDSVFGPATELIHRVIGTEFTSTQYAEITVFRRISPPLSQRNIEAAGSAPPPEKRGRPSAAGH